MVERNGPQLDHFTTDHMAEDTVEETPQPMVQFKKKKNKSNLRKRVRTEVNDEVPDEGNVAIKKTKSARTINTYSVRFPTSAILLVSII